MTAATEAISRLSLVSGMLSKGLGLERFGSKGCKRLVVVMS